MVDIGRRQRCHGSHRKQPALSAASPDRASSPQKEFQSSIQHVLFLASCFFLFASDVFSLLRLPPSLTPDTTSSRENVLGPFPPPKKETRKGGRRWPEARKKADAPTTSTYLGGSHPPALSATSGSSNRGFSSDLSERPDRSSSYPLLDLNTRPNIRKLARMRSQFYIICSNIVLLLQSNNAYMYIHKLCNMTNKFFAV